MHMGMEIEPAGMRMQHRHRAGAALQLLVVLAESAQRLPSALHQLGVEQALMLPGQRAQFRGQGERDQEIAARHPPLRLPLDPLLALKVLAMRTIAMTAGVRRQALFIS